MGRTWRVEKDRLILARGDGADTLTITEVTTNRLELSGESVKYSLSRFDNAEALELRLAEAEGRVRNLERSKKLYDSQHLQAAADSVQREIERARVELDSLRRENEP